MKCWVLLVNRNRGKLYKKASYEASVGKIKRGWRDNLGFFIPDESIPVEVEKMLGTIPLWVVNEKTSMALGIEASKEVLEVASGLKLKDNDPKPPKETITLKEKTDVDAHTKLNLLCKKEFWKQVAEKIKLSKMDTFIYLCAGFGIGRMIEYIITLIFTPH